MKSKAILKIFLVSLSLIIGGQSYCDTLRVHVNIHSHYSEMDSYNIPMMKVITERQWAAQNETAMKIDYIKDALNSIKRQNYDEAIDNCLKGLSYANYLNDSEKIIPKYYHYIGFAYLKNDDLQFLFEVFQRQNKKLLQK